MSYADRISASEAVSHSSEDFLHGVDLLRSERVLLSPVVRESLGIASRVLSTGESIELFSTDTEV